MSGAGSVRPATAEDAAAIARVRAACWRQAYAHLVGEDLLARIDREVDENAATWRRVITDGFPAQVALVDGEVVGFSGALDHRAHPGAPGRPADAERPADLELRVLYLLAVHHGSGLGQRLLEAAVPPGRGCYLWTAEDNPRARAFYARNGFRPDGPRQTEPDWDDLVEIRMVRPGSAE